MIKSLNYLRTNKIIKLMLILKFALLSESLSVDDQKTTIFHLYVHPKSFWVSRYIQRGEVYRLEMNVLNFCWNSPQETFSVNWFVCFSTRSTPKKIFGRFWWMRFWFNLFRARWTVNKDVILKYYFLIRQNSKESLK